MQTRSKTKGRAGGTAEVTNEVPPQTARNQPGDEGPRPGEKGQRVETTSPTRKKVKPQPPQGKARPRRSAKRSEPKPFVLDDSVLKLNPYKYRDMLTLIRIVEENKWDWTDLQKPYFYEHRHIPIKLEGPLEERAIFVGHGKGPKDAQRELVVRWPISVVFTYNCGRFVMHGISRLKREGDRMSENEARNFAEKCLVKAAAAGMTLEDRDVIELLIGYGAQNMWDGITAAAKRGHNDTIKDLYESFEKILGENHRMFAPESVNWDGLFYAAEWGQNETIDFLDSFFGMSPNADSMDVAECAFICSSMEPVHKLIHFAAGRDHVHTVRHLIEEYDYSPNMCLRFGETVLDVAKQRGARRVIEYLEANGGVEEWMTWDTDSSMYNLSDSDGISVISDDALETMDQRVRKDMTYITDLVDKDLRKNHGIPAMWHNVAQVLTLIPRKYSAVERNTGQGGPFDPPVEGGGSNYGPKPLTRSRLKRIWHKLGGLFKISDDDKKRNWW